MTDKHLFAAIVDLLIGSVLILNFSVGNFFPFLYVVHNNNKVNVRHLCTRSETLEVTGRLANAKRRHLCVRGGRDSVAAGDNAENKSFFVLLSS